MEIGVLGLVPWLVPWLGGGCRKGSPEMSGQFWPWALSLQPPQHPQSGPASSRALVRAAALAGPDLVF